MQISFLFILVRFPVPFIVCSLFFLWVSNDPKVFQRIIWDRLGSTRCTEKRTRIKRKEICIFAKILFYFHTIWIFISYMFHLIFLYTVWYIHAIYRKQLMSWYKYKIIECLEPLGWFHIYCLISNNIQGNNMKHMGNKNPNRVEIK